MEEVVDRFICELCNKSYKLKKALETHKSKCGVVQDTIKFPCRYCNKVYSYQQGRSFHEKKCKLMLTINEVGCEKFPKISKEEILRILLSDNILEAGLDYLYSIPENHNLLIKSPSSEYAECISDGKLRKISMNTRIRLKMHSLLDGLMVLFIEYYYMYDDDSDFDKNKDIVLSKLRSLQMLILTKQTSPKFIKEWSIVLSNYKDSIMTTWEKRRESLRSIEYFDKSKYFNLIKELKENLIVNQHNNFGIFNDNINVDYLY